MAAFKKEHPMRVSKSVGLIALGFFFGIAAGMASSRIEAQGVTEAPVIQLGEPVGAIITSENIGFQLAAAQKRGDVATGRLMIKVNGRWLPAAAPMSVIPAR
jgi:hypothetical protein